MKGTPTLVKSLFTLTIAYYCFFTPDSQKVLSPFANNPFKQLQEWFQYILQPRLDRGVIQEPESFMTTVRIMIYQFGG